MAGRTELEPYRTRKPSAERRREIADAALRILGERGAVALTASALADAVGLTSGALFRHFDSLDDVLETAVERAVAAIDGTFPPAELPPLERLTGLARARVRLLSTEPGLACLLRSEQAFLVLPEPARARLTELVARSRRFMLEALRDGARAGTIRRDLAPELLLFPISGTIHALVGFPGAHGSVARAGAHAHEPAIRALAQLLSPPARKGARAGTPKQVSTEPTRRRLKP